MVENCKILYRFLLSIAMNLTVQCNLRIFNIYNGIIRFYSLTHIDSEALRQ